MRAHFRAVAALDRLSVSPASDKAGEKAKEE
jgi:hypothetical protein